LISLDCVGEHIGEQKELGDIEEIRRISIYISLFISDYIRLLNEFGIIGTIDIRRLDLGTKRQVALNTLK
jgi:hypothetical protein